MYAERIKNQGRTMDRSTRLMLEVYIPTFSVCALLGVTGWITTDAIAVIQGNGDDDDVDVVFLYAFAVSNFVVDGISSWLFYVRGKDIFVESEDADLYAAIDAMTDKLDRQVQKYKQKLTDHNHESVKHQAPPEV